MKVNNRILSVFSSLILLSLFGCAVSHSTSSRMTLQNETPHSIVEQGTDYKDTLYRAKNISTKDLLVGKQKIILDNHLGRDGQLAVTQADFQKPNSTYVIRSVFNLMGGEISIPSDCALVFDGGGFENGAIIGNETTLLYTGTIFNDVNIKGSWDVPEIHSSMFGDVNTACDRLKDVMALTNSNVENIVYIDRGNYTLEVDEVAEHLLPLKSHTTIILEGTINVIGNSFPRYRILSMFDISDVTIKGSGRIIGDRDKHAYIPESPDPESKRGFNTTHEYGHGIQIANSRNIDISGISISNCIGDGVCINGTDISCRNLTITNCRRQGISVVGGERISILECDISHVWGSKKAGFGIDVEPGSGHNVSSVRISNCNITSCNGGINTQCHSFESVKHVTISNCYLSGFAKDIIKEDGHEQYIAAMCFGARDVEWINCTIEDTNTMMYIEDAVDFAIKQCNLVSRGSHYGIILRNNRGDVVIDDNDIYLYDAKSQSTKGVAIANLHNAVVVNNEILADNLSFSGDTDCQNVVLSGNTIDAKWEPGRVVRDSRVENNTFTQRVVLNDVIQSSVNGNRMHSLKVKKKYDSIIFSNSIEKTK